MDDMDELAFAVRLARLEDAISRAVQVATELRLASRPDPTAPRSRLDTLRQRVGRTAQVAIRPAQLAAAAPTPPEVHDWVEGLGRFHRALSAAADARRSDGAMVRAELEREVDRLTGAVSAAVDARVEVLGEVANRVTGRARLAGDLLADIETRLRGELDRAAAGFVPAGPDQGLFSGLVANRVVNGPAYTRLVEIGDALSVADEPGRLTLDRPGRPDRSGAPGDRALAPPVSADAPNGPPPPAAITPAELDELDPPCPRGGFDRPDATDDIAAIGAPRLDPPPGDEPGEDPTRRRYEP